MVLGVWGRLRMLKPPTEVHVAARQTFVLLEKMSEQTKEVELSIHEHMCVRLWTLVCVCERERT